MHSELKALLSGPIFTIFTPFDASYSIDYESLGRYIDHLYSGGARVFYVMAYNSRYSQLTNSEIRNLNAFCAKHVKELDPTNTIIVGDPIHCSTSESLDFAQSAKEAGADAISLLFREKYFSDDQVLSHYSYIAEQSQFPIIVHEMPFLSGYTGEQINWPDTLLKQISDIPLVVGMKEDAKDQRVAKYVLTLQPSIKVIFAGTKRTFLPLLRHGLSAYLNGISIIDARIGLLFWRAHINNDIQLITQIVEKLEDPFFLGPVQKYGWHRCNKALLQAHGLMHRRDRPPMPSLTDREYLEVVEVHSRILDNFAALFPSY